MDDSEKWKGEQGDYHFGGLWAGLFPTPGQLEKSRQKAAADVMLAEVSYPTMLRYSEGESCSKCGATSHRLRYCAPGYVARSFGRDGEGLEVRCRRCRHVWYRRCIDAPEAA